MTYRAWKTAEVPVGALTRPIDAKDSGRSLIISVGSTALLAGRLEFTFDFILKFGEHSLDGGKTWKPCGILLE